MSERRKVRNPFPKHLRMPANGLSIEDEPDDVKATRMLAGFRHMAAKKGPQAFGFTVDGVPYMIIKFCPQPDGPHPPDADLTGIEL